MMDDANKSDLNKVDETEKVKKLTKKPGDRRGGKIRTTHVNINSPGELGALLRRVRIRSEISQQDTATISEVTRRFLVDLEDGKERNDIGKLFKLLNYFGLSLTVTGDGARFTPQELEHTYVKTKIGEPHVWVAQWERTREAPYQQKNVRRGRNAGQLTDESKYMPCRVLNELGEDMLLKGLHHRSRAYKAKQKSEE